MSNKTNPYKLFIMKPLQYLRALLAVSLVLVSCERFEAYPDGKFTVNDARENFEQNAKTLNYPEIVCPAEKTKSLGLNIVPLWSQSETYSDENRSAVMVPIMERGQFSGALSYTYGRRKIARSSGVEVHSYLNIVRSKSTQETVRFISTAIGINTGRGKEPYLMSGDRSEFRGYMILSTEDGQVSGIYYYENGVRIKMKYHKDWNNASEEKRKYYCLYEFSVSMRKSTKAGGGEGYSSGEDEDSFCYVCGCLRSFIDGCCSECNTPLEQIDPAITTPDDEPDPLPDPEAPDWRCPFCLRTDCDGLCWLNNTDIRNQVINSLPGPGIGIGINSIGVLDHCIDFVHQNCNLYVSPIPQEENMCTLESVAYLLRIFNNGNSSSWTGNDVLSLCFSLLHNDFYGATPFLGVPFPEVQNVVNLFFASNFPFHTLGNIPSWINNNIPLLTVMPYRNPDNDFGMHTVVIVGYTEDGNIIYMDPQKTQLQLTEESNFDYAESWPIMEK